MIHLPADHGLFVMFVPRRTQLLDVIRAAIDYAEEHRAVVNTLVSPETLQLFTAALEVAGDGAQVRQIRAIDDQYNGPRPVLDSIDTVCRETQSALVLLDLDSFPAGTTPGDVAHIASRLRQIATNRRALIFCFVNAGALFRTLPAEFFDVLSGFFIDGAGTTADIDSATLSVAIAGSKSRQSLMNGLAEERRPAGAPSFFRDYRHGVMLVDTEFEIRYCSPRAAALLGREPGDLVGRPVRVCVDGVDLVTFRHECEKLTPGSPRRPPFVASFRISPGEYQPRQVSVDPATAGQHTVGYLIGLSTVEQVRGPRAVYRQLKADMAQDPDDAAPREPPSDGDVSGELNDTHITRREHEIILLVLGGMSNRQISDRLRIAEVTVKKHLTSVYRKLRITNRQELMVSFARPGGRS